MSDLEPGVYEDLVTASIQRALSRLESERLVSRLLDAAEADDFLTSHVASVVRRAMRSRASHDGTASEAQVELANRIIEVLGHGMPDAAVSDWLVTDPATLLLTVREGSALEGPPPERPEVPLSRSDLLVNGRGQPRIGSEIQRELATAKSVDLICAFIKWTGYRIIERELKALVGRGGKVRVLTTTYLGSTERRAIDALVDLGAEVRISYDVHSTRLHAKAWLFHRPTLATAYVGSSNLTKTALVDGLEWNVRLSERDHPHLIPTFQATFDQLWNDGGFEPYDPAVDGDRFDAAVRTERVGADDTEIDLTFLEVRPFSYQQEVLDALAAERTLHSRNHNLVVMATGTGKTVVAALDYRRLRTSGEVDHLLFVAHRDEILRRSRSTFRHVLRDGSFGELLVGGARPEGWDYVFASVQSLATMDLNRLPASHFDMVIIDEFHHAEAPTYTRLLNHLKPKQLIGLTATPERSDGRDVTIWFEGRIAAELRLWEAIDRGMVCPFQYFGVADDVDLSQVSWKRGRYDAGELSRIYSPNDARALKVIEAVRRVVSSTGSMRALGFCVSVDHALYMARVFNRAGIPSVVVSATTPSSERASALRNLEAGRVNVVFAVDLFNEGVDLPHVDTVLFLRPTESSTLYLQQLGRGLRLADGKACLTVLDFIGHQHAQFRFDQRFVALTGTKRPQLARAIDDGFPQLPAGCHIELDRVAKEIVLGNVRQAIASHWRQLARDVKSMWPCTLNEFVKESGIELEDLYASSRTGWLGLLQTAGLRSDAADPVLVKGARRMLHVDDPDRYMYYAEAARGASAAIADSERRRRLAAMLHFTLWGTSRSVSEATDAVRELEGSPHREEIAEILQILAERTTRLTFPLPATWPSVPLRVHGSYTRDEALAAFGMMTPAAVREGVRYVDDERADLLFVTLRKSERHYSPTTMYQDRALTPELFHWQSQSTTSVRSKTGQRYINHRDEGTSVHLFVREDRSTETGIAAPYLYAGPVDYQEHSGDRPIDIVWRLQTPLPADMYVAARAVAA